MSRPWLVSLRIACAGARRQPKREPQGPSFGRKAAACQSAWARSPCGETRGGRVIRGLTLLAALVLAPSLAWAQSQDLFQQASGQLASAGWAGFLDTKFMVESLGALALAAVLGALIGYHPITPRTV